MPSATSVAAGEPVALLTLHLDGLYEGGVLVRQNPWSKFDPDGLFQADPRVAFEGAQQAFQAAPPQMKPIIGVAVAVTFAAAVVVVAGKELTDNARPLMGCGPNSCASGPMSMGQSGKPQQFEKGLIMPQQTQDDSDAYSRFLANGDRRALDDYLGQRSSDGNPSGESAKETKQTTGRGNLNHEDNFDKARLKAFANAGMTNPDKVEFSKMDPTTGTVVEFKGEKAAKVAYDPPHADMNPATGHDKPHVGWQTSGKQPAGGHRGNITYDGPQHPSRPKEKRK